MASEIVWSPVPISGMPSLVVKEDTIFSLQITCVYIDEAGAQHPCNLVINPLENNPSTILLTNGSVGAIAGHYGAQFNDTIKVMKADYSHDIFDTLNSEPKGVSVWDKLNVKEYSEIIGFIPDPTRDKWYHYDVKAYRNNIIVSTMTYIIRLHDPDWETGKIRFKEVVNASNS